MIEHTIAELRDVALDADDAAGYFPALYVRVTEDITADIRAGRFDDGERMERLVEALAGYYLRARRGEGSVPRCWQATWDVAADPDVLIVQHLLLGMNAHVNHDLAQAIVEIAPHYGGLQAVRADFGVTNDVLARLVHRVLLASKPTGSPPVQRTVACSPLTDICHPAVFALDRGDHRP